jgi:hypothetical protein
MIATNTCVTSASTNWSTLGHTDLDKFMKSPKRGHIATEASRAYFDVIFSKIDP